MKKLILALAMVVVVVVAGSTRASANPAVFTVDYNYTNLYSPTHTLLYEFSGLDATVGYLFWVDLIDESGNTTQRIAEYYAFGDTTFNIVLTTLNGGGFPPGYTGAFKVWDSWGGFVNYHYLMPLPSTDWFSGDGEYAANEKVVMGAPISSGECRSPVFRDLDANGLHFATNAPCSVQVVNESYFILWINMDAADVGDNDTVRIGNMASLSEFMDIDLDDYAAFQFGGFSGGITDLNTYNYIVVNLDDEPLPFVNNLRASGIFTTEDNPLVYSVENPDSFEAGVYYCGRFEHDSTPFTLISNCESPLLVGNIAGVNEWSIEARYDPIPESQQQQITQRQYTEEIWETYNGGSVVEDSEEGVLDSNVYEYFQTRTSTFQVGANSGGETLSWSVTPQSLAYGLGLIELLPAEWIFEVLDLYEIVPPGTVAPPGVGGIGFNLLERLGLNTPMGKIFALVLVMLISLKGTASLTGRKEAQVLVFSIMSGLFLLLIPMDFVTFSALIMMNFILWMWVFSTRGDGSDVSL